MKAATRDMKVWIGLAGLLMGAMVLVAMALRWRGVVVPMGPVESPPPVMPVSPPVPDPPDFPDDRPPVLWEAFVVDGERLMYYDGRTSVRMKPLGPDVKEIVVDAFPEPPTTPAGRPRYVTGGEGREGM